MSDSRTASDRHLVEPAAGCETIWRLPVVLRERGRSRSSHYLDIKLGLFTPPVQIGLRAVGWPATEVAMLNAARIAGKSDEEIRALVAKLEAARKAAV